MYDNKGNVISSDTTYNNVNSTHPKYLEYKKQFEKKEGGYLSLQKQGGKLTEIWTPYN